MTPAEILRAAADKLDEGWTQGAHARDGDGRPVHALSQTACAWCAEGAMAAAAGTVTVFIDPAVYEALGAATGRPAPVWLQSRKLNLWNDEPGRTKEQVQAAMRAAADQLESEND